MVWIYVATSKSLQEWGASVGVTKHLYKIGVCEAPPAEAVASLNATRQAGAEDWKLLKKRQVEAADEAAILARLAAQEQVLDGRYYPRLEGAVGICKVKPLNVTNALLVQRALDAGELKVDRLKPADIAEYLLRNAME
ncbi:MAG: hypothetical protein KIT20_15320 [Alphaproteobacteria bacterium]|nr:hypothetical protein [Alphaproteobacteria bacterium]